MSSPGEGFQTEHKARAAGMPGQHQHRGRGGREGEGGSGRRKRKRDGEGEGWRDPRIQRALYAGTREASLESHQHFKAGAQGAPDNSYSGALFT